MRVEPNLEAGLGDGRTLAAFSMEAAPRFFIKTRLGLMESPEPKLTLG